MVKACDFNMAISLQLYLEDVLLRYKPRALLHVEICNLLNPKFQRSSDAHVILAALENAFKFLEIPLYSSFRINIEWLVPRFKVGKAGEHTWGTPNSFSYKCIGNTWKKSFLTHFSTKKEISFSSKH